MIVTNIYHDDDFVKRFQKMPIDIQKVAAAKTELFKSNPLHPSLRLHMLSGKLLGLWLISLTKNYRLIFERQDNGDIFFVSIGSHDIYKYL